MLPQSPPIPPEEDAVERVEDFDCHYLTSFNIISSIKQHLVLMEI
jgi:hypothetical protein